MLKLHIRPDNELVFASSEKAWHQVKPTLPNPFSARDALHLTGLSDFAFHEREIFTRGTYGMLPMEDRKAILLYDNTYRQDYYSADVGASRKIFTPSDMAETADRLQDVSDAYCATAGMWSNGTGWFMCMKVGEEVTIGGDSHWLYLTVSDSVFGAFRAYPTLIRWDCWNTMMASRAAHIKAMAKGESVEFSLRHTVNAKLNVAQMRSALKIGYAFAESTNEVAKRLLDQAMSHEEWLGFAQDFLRIDDRNAMVAGVSKTLAPAAATRAFNRFGLLDTRLTEPENASTMRNNTFTRWSAYQASIRYLELDRRPQTSATAADAFSRSINIGVAREKDRALELLLR